MKTVKIGKNIIFAKPLTAEKTTKSGIFLTDSAVEVLHHAEVVNVGSGVSEYAQRDVIIYKDYSASETKIEGDDYILLFEEDVLGKIMEVVDEQD